MAQPLVQAEAPKPYEAECNQVHHTDRTRDGRPVMKKVGLLFNFCGCWLLKMIQVWVWETRVCNARCAMCEAPKARRHARMALTGLAVVLQTHGGMEAVARSHGPWHRVDCLAGTSLPVVVVCCGTQWPVQWIVLGTWQPWSVIASAVGRRRECVSNLCTKPMALAIGN